MSAKQKMSPEQRVQAMQSARKLKTEKEQRERNDHIAILRSGFRKENPEIDEKDLQAKIDASLAREDLDKQIAKARDSYEGLIVKRAMLNKKSGSKEIEKLKEKLSKLVA